MIVLDGAGLTPRALAAVARDGARAELGEAARARNAAAHEVVLGLVSRGVPLYGVSTGVGALRDRALAGDDRAAQQLRLLRSHAAGAGPVMPVEVVRAGMAARANQLGAGGAGVDPSLPDALVALLGAGLVPVTRELGSLGTGDLTALADIGLALLGEGRVRRGAGELVDAGPALAAAGISPARLGPRDGIAFMSSNAVTAGHAALLLVDARTLLDAWLTVAALSFEAAAADPVVLDARVHAARGQPGQAAVAARLAALLAGLGDRRRSVPDAPIQDPYPFRALPQVDGIVDDALAALDTVVTNELNARAENALVDVVEGVALPNGNPHAAPLAAALDAVRTALAQSAALIAARVSALLDTTLTGLPPFLARRPGPESGALILEYTAHAAAAEVRSLVTPVAAQTVSVARGVESHASLAPIAARRTQEALDALRVVVATELVTAVRALRLAGHGPVATGTRALHAAATARLDPGLADRPLGDDVEAARALLERWPPDVSRG